MVNSLWSYVPVPALSGNNPQDDFFPTLRGALRACCTAKAAYQPLCAGVRDGGAGRAVFRQRVTADGSAAV